MKNSDVKILTALLFVIMVLLAVVAIGQWRIYPRLDQLETNFVSPAIPPVKP